MNFLLESLVQIIQEQLEIEIRKLQHQYLDRQIVIEASRPTHKEEGVHVMEVGKIVIQEAQGGSQYNPTVGEESLTVDMGGGIIVLRVEQSRSERERMYTIKPVQLTAEQALELGQVLLKAAEILPEYRDAINKITEERTKIEARYKDMISGLGLNSEVDVLDERGTFKVIESV